MSQPASHGEPPRKETPFEHQARIRREVREGRLTVHQLMVMCNKGLPPADAARALANVLLPW